jgi:hypothetical protein
VTPAGYSLLITSTINGVSPSGSGIRRGGPPNAPSSSDRGVVPVGLHAPKHFPCPHVRPHRKLSARRSILDVAQTPHPTVLR